MLPDRELCLHFLRYCKGPFNHQQYHEKYNSCHDPGTANDTGSGAQQWISRTIVWFSRRSDIITMNSVCHY